MAFIVQQSPPPMPVQFVILSCAILGSFLSTSPTHAQITPDSSLGSEASVLRTNVLIRERLGDRIEGGATRGAN